MREALGFEVGAQVLTKALDDVEGALILDAATEDAVARSPIPGLRADRCERLGKPSLADGPRFDLVAIHTRMAEKADASRRCFLPKISRRFKGARPDVVTEKKEERARPRRHTLQPRLRPHSQKGRDLVSARSGDDNNVGLRGGLSGLVAVIFHTEEVHLPNLDREIDLLRLIASQDVAGAESARGRNNIFVNDDQVEIFAVVIRGGDSVALFDEVIHGEAVVADFLVGLFLFARRSGRVVLMHQCENRHYGVFPR